MWLSELVHNYALGAVHSRCWATYKLALTVPSSHTSTTTTDLLAFLCIQHTPVVLPLLFPLTVNELIR